MKMVSLMIITALTLTLGPVLGGRTALAGDPIEVKIVTFRPPSISAVMNPLIKAKGFDKKNG
ncbi:MAG: hypothetical protein V3V56_11480, partial [bacterium]